MSVTLIVVSVTLPMKRQLHVTITGRQAVRVVIAAQHDDRRDPIRVARDGDIEVPPIGNLARSLRDHGSHCPSAVLLEQVRREEQLPDGNSLVGIPAWEQAGIRGHHRKRRVVGSHQVFPVLPREDHRGIR